MGCVTGINFPRSLQKPMDDLLHLFQSLLPEPSTNTATCRLAFHKEKKKSLCATLH